MKRWLVVAVVAGAAAILVVIFLALFERVDREVLVGPQGEAARNPYLAARRLVAEMGRDARKVDDFTDLEPLPDTGTTIVFPGVREALGRQRSAALLEWVRAGGHLVVTAAQPEEEGDVDALLGPLRIEVFDDAAGLVAWHPPGQSRGQVVDFPDGVTLDTTGEAPVWSLGAGRRDAVQQHAVGDGLVTVLGSDAFFQNQWLGEHGNAGFLWWLLTCREADGAVWFVERGYPPSIAAVLFRRASALVASVAVLLLLWIWSVARRFGPAAASPFVPRRSMREHIDAMAHFLWRNGHGDALLQSTRARVRQAAARRVAGFAHLGDEEQEQVLAQRAGIERERVRAALGSRPGRDRAGFLEVVRALERIRHSL